jgi:hypothetical protein
MSVMKKKGEGTEGEEREIDVLGTVALDTVGQALDAKARIQLRIETKMPPDEGGRERERTSHERVGIRRLQAG